MPPKTAPWKDYSSLVFGIRDIKTHANEFTPLILIRQCEQIAVSLATLFGSSETSVLNSRTWREKGAEAGGLLGQLYRGTKQDSTGEQKS